MSCDEIKIIEGTNTIQVFDNKNIVDVVDQENKIEVLDHKDVVEVKEEVGEKVVINATDVRFSIVQTIDIEMGCTAVETIGDAVYVISDGQVRQANNSDISTAKVMGFIVSKDSDTTCKVRVAGVMDEFTGLVAGSQYFLNNVNGDIDLTAPTVSGSVIVRTGQALSSDKFLVNINNNYIIRG